MLRWISRPAKRFFQKKWKVVAKNRSFYPRRRKKVTHALPIERVPPRNVDPTSEFPACTICTLLTNTVIYPSLTIKLPKLGRHIILNPLSFNGTLLNWPYQGIFKNDIHPYTPSEIGHTHIIYNYTQSSVLNLPLLISNSSYRLSRPETLVI
jgi:hypothetical protein